LFRQPNSPQQNFLSRKSQKDRRAKNIIIEDSFRTFNCVTFEKSSKLLTGRAPFRKDSELIDYEMDSEEEWAEQNGEDVSQNEDDDDEMADNSEEEEED